MPFCILDSRKLVPLFGDTPPHPTKNWSRCPCSAVHHEQQTNHVLHLLNIFHELNLNHIILFTLRHLGQT